MTCRVVIILHDLDHLVAALVHLDKSEDDPTLRKLSHLVLDLVAVRRALRVIVTIFADVFAVTWSIRDMES